MSFYSFIIYLFTCPFVYECFACLYVSVPYHACNYPERPKEYMESTETGGESGHVGAGKRTKPWSSARQGSALSCGNIGPSTVFKCPLSTFFCEELNICCLRCCLLMAYLPLPNIFALLKKTLLKNNSEGFNHYCIGLTKECFRIIFIIKHLRK